MQGTGWKAGGHTRLPVSPTGAGKGWGRRTGPGFGQRSSISPRPGCGGGRRLPGLRRGLSPSSPHRYWCPGCGGAGGAAAVPVPLRTERGAGGPRPGGEGAAGGELTWAAFVSQSCCGRCAQTLLYVPQKNFLWGLCLPEGLVLCGVFPSLELIDTSARYRELLIPSPREVRALNFFFFPPPPSLL